MRSIEKKRTKKTQKSAPPKTHHEIHSSPATASNSRRHSTKHVPHVRPYSPASIDPGFVELGPVQPSQSVKTKNFTRTHDKRTERLTKYWHSVPHPGMKRLFAQRLKTAWISLLPRPCLIIIVYRLPTKLTDIFLNGLRVFTPSCLRARSR